MQVCGAIFRMDSNANGPGVRYVWEHPEILDLLFQGWEPLIGLLALTSGHTVHAHLCCARCC